MSKFFFIGFLFCVFRGIDNLIVPDEVPSLLSLIYSNIPPIKKGTDSRLGWGFRLGDHADFQVLLELGPQTNTRPLGNEGDKNNKRTVGNFRDTLYAQTQYLKQKQEELKDKDLEQISDTEGGKWMQTWKSEMENSSVEPLPLFAVGEVDATKALPPELEDLYGNRQDKSRKLAKNT